MDQFARLAIYLEDVVHNPNVDLSKLQLKLERARPAFLSLLNTPPKNQKERAALEKGSSRILTVVSAGQLALHELSSSGALGRRQ